jgi:hypothetical protein
MLGLELTNAHRVYTHALLQRVVVSGPKPESVGADCGEIEVGDILIEVDDISLQTMCDNEDALLRSAKSVMEHTNKHHTNNNSWTEANDPPLTSVFTSKARPPRSSC